MKAKTIDKNNDIRNYLIKSKNFEQLSYKNLYVNNGIVIQHIKVKPKTLSFEIENIDLNNELLKDIREFKYIIELNELNGFLLVDKEEIDDLFSSKLIKYANLQVLKLSYYYIPAILEDTLAYIIMKNFYDNMDKFLSAILLDFNDIDCLLSDFV